MTGKELGDILVKKGLVRADQVDAALRLQKESGEPLGKVLCAMGHLREDDLYDVLAEVFAMPRIALDRYELPKEMLSILPSDFVREHRIIPLSRNNSTLVCATCDPMDFSAIEAIRYATRCDVELQLATERDIQETIEKHFGVTVQSMIEEMGGGSGADEDEDGYRIDDVSELAREPTLINLVNLIISQAIADRASDIHVEPFERTLKIKYRIDGVLHEMPPPPKRFQGAIVSRIKIMAGMDIAERYVPQDGHIRINLPDARVDIRVSTVPTIHGESVVMRLLNKSALLITLDDLGLGDKTKERFLQLIHRPYGIILVCGPTGSGKTTTLYAALTRIYTSEKKIITIEDPVEYELEGVNQIPVRPKRGLSFATGLRHIVRQDPDIIMVGEIRDVETAEIAIRAALTGHLVFSTVHTNDAPGAVTRLVDMGVEPFLVASSTQGILAQRLVRKLCNHCKQPFRPEPIMFRDFNMENEEIPEQVFRPVGCEDCRNRGFLGRTGVFELLLMNDRIHTLVLERASTADIRREAVKTMTTMRQDGLRKIREGITSIEEVLQATAQEMITDSEELTVAEKARDTIEDE
ncbi:MAG: ATPase, T2SS/T4P/T4SS family [Candidatus Sumerlaeia bacterium]|nr:ATPase, T2SS/T4P/T4SS family [Candidatus Sumerlaeia bacterium]